MDRYEFMILILMGCIESGANVIYIYIHNLFTNLVGLMMMMVMMMIMLNMVTSDERESNQEKT